MSINNISIIVPGGLNTDIIGVKVNKILKPGELTHGKELKIGPGGKSRNIAQMIAGLTGKNIVAMIGRTSRDPFNLWKIPVDALIKAGVNTDYIAISDFKKTGKFPGVALIPVDKKGNNQIYVLPGVNDDFSSSDIEKALPLFEKAKRNSGLLALSMELPLPAAIHAVKRANQYHLRVVIDPGGIEKGTDYKELMSQKIYLLKPNKHEAEILTGIKVRDFNSAEKSARRLLKRNIENVLITNGRNGAYLFNKSIARHIPVPKIKKSAINDETGCGDQATAALCAFLLSGKDVFEASKLAVLAGTLQFNKLGVSPVTKKELKIILIQAAL